MRKILLPLSIAAALALGAGLATITPPAPAPAAVCQEDDPCWDCSAMGNRICGPTSSDEIAAAWQVWEYAGGAHSLRVDTSRPFRVEYVGAARDYPRGVTDAEVALVGKDFRWYVFRAAVTG